MRFLFVHQNFPGQYLHVVRQLLRDPQHEVTFLTTANSNHLSGVRRVDYRLLQGTTPGVHPMARDFESAMIRAASAAAVAKQLAGLGYRPDVMIGHNGWGEVLNLKDVWPDVPLIPYFEFFYADRGLDVDFDPEFPADESHRATIRARNAVNLLGLAVADVGQTPTRFQHETYPAWARDRIRVVPEGIDLAVCRPKADAVFTLPDGSRRWPRAKRAGQRKLLTYVARNLEPYRGFHVFMRSLPAVLRERPDVDVIVVGGDSVSYGPALPPGETWRQRMVAELGDALPLERVFFVGQLPFEDYVALLQTSAVHVYLTYPFVASWSLREALACGCAIVGSDTAPVREFVSSGETGRLVPFHAPSLLSDSILEVMDNNAERSRLGQAGAHFAKGAFRFEAQLDALLALIQSIQV